MPTPPHTSSPPRFPPKLIIGLAIGWVLIVVKCAFSGVVFTVPGLDAPRALAVDPGSGEAWVACAGSGEIVRIAPDGTVLRRLDAFGSASGIALTTRLGTAPGP